MSECEIVPPETVAVAKATEQPSQPMPTSMKCVFGFLGVLAFCVVTLLLCCLALHLALEVKEAWIKLFGN